MQRVLTGRDKVFNQANVRTWMRAHGRGGYLELAAQAQLAFGVEAMMVGFEPGDHWLWDVAVSELAARVWDVAVGVVAEREGHHALAS
jgi:hypothetical protein